MKTSISSGLDVFCTQPPDIPSEKRLGLLCNPASVTSSLTHASLAVNRQFPGQLKALFSPQHGFHAEKQDNMVESGDLVDSALNIPVFSLYGDTRIPTRAMFDLIDILLIDLQDAGTRVYTFIYTISYCLEAAARFDKEVIVLDRPNPVGGIDIEGNLLSERWTSFVGRYPIPMRHGLTMGELALLINSRFGIHSRLSVIPMKGWKRSLYFDDTSLIWIAPSPNLPTPASAMVYPGQVVIEGTTLSEGRGTTQPFELFGAPYLEPDRLLDQIGESLRGIVLRPVCFEPTSGKYQGSPCRGFQIHVTSRSDYKPYRTTLVLLQLIMKLYPDQFRWKQPPYEYEFQRLPIDLILGCRQVRQRLEQMESVESLEKAWEPEIETFRKIKLDYHLYD